MSVSEAERTIRVILAVSSMHDLHLCHRQTLHPLIMLLNGLWDLITLRDPTNTLTENNPSTLHCFKLITLNMLPYASGQGPWGGPGGGTFMIFTRGGWAGTETPRP